MTRYQLQLCTRFSALQRAEIAEILHQARVAKKNPRPVSVLFNEPKLLKCRPLLAPRRTGGGFSALQRAEIAEMRRRRSATRAYCPCFSALQRAEIAEMVYTAATSRLSRALRFSALQRAEIAEIVDLPHRPRCARGFQCSSTSRNC